MNKSLNRRKFLQYSSSAAIFVAVGVYPNISSAEIKPQFPPLSLGDNIDEFKAEKVRRLAGYILTKEDDRLISREYRPVKDPAENLDSYEFANVKMVIGHLEYEVEIYNHNQEGKRKRNKEWYPNTEDRAPGIWFLDFDDIRFSITTNNQLINPNKRKITMFNDEGLTGICNEMSIVSFNEEISGRSNYNNTKKNNDKSKKIPQMVYDATVNTLLRFYEKA